MKIRALLVAAVLATTLGFAGTGERSWPARHWEPPDHDGTGHRTGVHRSQ